MIRGRAAFRAASAPTGLLLPSACTPYRFIGRVVDLAVAIAALLAFVTGASFRWHGVASGGPGSLSRSWQLAAGGHPGDYGPCVDRAGAGATGLYRREQRWIERTGGA